MNGSKKQEKSDLQSTVPILNSNTNNNIIKIQSNSI